MLILHPEQCLDGSDKQRARTLSIWFCKVPVVVLSRHEVNSLVVRSEDPLR